MDFSGRVHEWREEPFQDSELPAIEFRDPVMETGAETIQTWLHRLTLRVRVNARTMREIREIHAAIDKAIGVDTTLGGLTLIIERVSDQNEITHEEHRYFSSIVEYAARFPTPEWDHYH